MLVKLLHFTLQEGRLGEIFCRIPVEKPKIVSLQHDKDTHQGHGPSVWSHKQAATRPRGATAENVIIRSPGESDAAHHSQKYIWGPGTFFI
jgi:hypothetical protein